MNRLTAIFRQSSYARLAAVFAIGASLVALVMLLGIYFLVAHLTQTRAHDALSAAAASYSEIYAQRRLPGLREAIDRQAAMPGAKVHVLLLDQDGGTLAGDPDLRERVPAGAGGDVSRTEHRLMRIENLRGGFQLTVAQDTGADDVLLRRLAIVLAGLGAGILGLGLVGGYALGRSALMRVAELDAVLRRIEHGDLAIRYAATARNDEFAAIGRAVNQMLDRLTATLGGFKELSDRIAHEMRTPLAHLRASLDALRRQAPAEQRAALGDLVAESDELIAVFTALLDIASTEAEAHDSHTFAPTNLDHIVDDVIELYGAVADDKNVTLQFDERGGACVQGDRPLLVRMIANVVDNAIKFSPPGARVVIASRVASDRVTLSIADSGPGVADDFRAKAFDRFARGTEAQSVPGHGLGLALVRAIAMRHGMKVELKDARPGLLVVFQGRGSAAPRAS